ncbi:uncharacterized protein DNG_05186 [Cephalotrichum gorgonifer]|uniref:Uncharacterized protein n=1 Tax=Cephalotrichum gorgonifer TaxID=2041049 RepID=A0AAE8MZY8_9PEZI|nr:uncharacterized protein DNG_05186 [Cephalotrichum gorgonifer]
MELLRSSDTRNLTPVLDWNIEEAVPEKGSVTSRLTKECVSIFRRLLKKLSQEEILSQEILRRLERSCSSLVLWESGYGVADGGLDDTLTKSRTLRRSTLEHLLNIGRALAHQLPPFIDGGDEKLGSHGAALRSVVAEAETSMHEGYQDGSDGEDSDSDGSSISPPSDWNEIAEDLQTDVQCLLDLGPLIKSPAADPVQLSREDKRIPEKLDPHVFYGDSIRVRFPKADPALVDRLARANLERFLKGRADREKNQGVGEMAVMAGTAETVAPYTEPVSKFHDSGLGTSINTGSAYAETVMSYHRKDGESVRIPPLPEEARKGRPFECVACGKNVVMRTTSAWKKHLFRDLCPWICHALQCNFGLFQSREDWVQHLSLQHELDPEWKSFACPMCEEDTGDGKFTITRHLSSHMEEISLKALPGGVEPDEISDSGTDDSSTTDTAGQTEKEMPKTLDLGADRRPSLSSELGPDAFLRTSLQDVNAEEEEPYRIKCICGYDEDDGNTIFCETCDTWQHIECFYPGHEEALREDFSHWCHECKPRTFDRETVIKKAVKRLVEAGSLQPARVKHSLTHSDRQQVKTQGAPAGDAQKPPPPSPHMEPEESVDDYFSDESAQHLKNKTYMFPAPLEDRLDLPVEHFMFPTPLEDQLDPPVEHFMFPTPLEDRLDPPVEHFVPAGGQSSSRGPFGNGASQAGPQLVAARAAEEGIRNYRRRGACTRCRLRKNRCNPSLSSPSCESCVKAGVVCQAYERPPPEKHASDGGPQPVTATAATERISKSRTARSCIRCGYRKLKCDRILPSCRHCLSARVVCEVYDPDTEKRILRRTLIETEPVADDEFAPVPADDELAPVPANDEFAPVLADVFNDYLMKEGNREHGNSARDRRVSDTTAWLQDVDYPSSSFFIETSVQMVAERREYTRIQTHSNSDSDEKQLRKSVTTPTDRTTTKPRDWVIDSDPGIDRPPIIATRRHVFGRSEAKSRSEDDGTTSISSRTPLPPALPSDGDKESIVPDVIDQHASTYGHSSEAWSVVSPPAEAPTSKMVHGSDQIYDQSIYSLTRGAPIEGSYICQDCVPPKRFTEKEDLYHHRVRAHDKIFPYACPDPECSRSFLDQGDLDRHLERMHVLKKSPRTGEAAPKDAGESNDVGAQRLPTAGDGGVAGNERVERIKRRVNELTGMDDEEIRRVVGAQGPGPGP